MVLWYHLIISVAKSAEIPVFYPKLFRYALQLLKGPLWTRQISLHLYIS